MVLGSIYILPDGSGVKNCMYECMKVMFYFDYKSIWQLLYVLWRPVWNYIVLIITTTNSSFLHRLTICIVMIMEKVTVNDFIIYSINIRFTVVFAVLQAPPSYFERVSKCAFQMKTKWATLHYKTPTAEVTIDVMISWKIQIFVKPL